MSEASVLHTGVVVTGDDLPGRRIPSVLSGGVTRRSSLC